MINNFFAFQHFSICKDMVLLTPNILITAREDHIVLWDISEANPIRIIILDPTESKQSYIKWLKLCSQSKTLVCDIGKQLCLVQFPGLTMKCD